MAEPKSVKIHLDPEGGANGHVPAAPGGPAAGPEPYASAPAAPSAPKAPFIDRCLGRSNANSERESEKLAVRQPKRKIKPGQEQIKRFYFRLDKIQASFEIGLDKAFLEFEFGGVTKDEKVDTGETETRTKKSKQADGSFKDEEYQERVFLKRIQVLKPKALTYFTRIKSNVKAKVKVPFHDHSCEGYWEGPYSDLEKEYITIKLWHYGGISEQNHLIGTGRECLKDIVASKIDRECRILKYSPGAALTRKETMARLIYKLEFQEDYKYNILFKDWELKRLHEPINPEVPKRRFCGCLASGERKLSFEIVQSRQGWIGWAISGLKAYCLYPWCSAKRWDNKCELLVEKEGTSGQRDGIIRYPGTRAWLEDESLSITLTKTICCCIPLVVGRKAEELQGVLDYGHIDTTIDVMEGVNLKNCWTKLLHPDELNTFRIAGTVDSSGMAEGENLPIFRQLGNADPGQDGLLQQEGATFLVVKVIRAKGLSIPSRDEFKETLNPSVSVYWNGMQKGTRIAKSTCDPFWDEEVHFKIMDRHTAKKKAPKKYEDFNEITRDSRIELLIWDNDGLAGRTALGKCYVDFYDVYFKRAHRKIMTFASNGRAVERLVFQSGEKVLEAPFATDGAERKKGRFEDEEGGGGKKSSGKSEAGTKFVEFLVYFDRKDSNPIPLINKKAKDMKDALALRQEQDLKHGGEPLSLSGIKSGRAYWDAALMDVLERQKRFFPFYGIDEYSGTFHFLPSFLKPMQPPAEVRAFGTLMFYIYCIEITRKPDPPFIDPLKDGTDPPRGDVWSWADPYFFLEKRKGDVKDHATILCNFLLGLGMDAYVCIGQARTKHKTATPTPHFWVMTREEVLIPIGDPTAAVPKTRKEYQVRFWEITNGRTYTLKGLLTEPPADRRGKKYLEQPDIKPPPVNEDEFKRLRERLLEEERQRALGIAPALDTVAEEDDEHKADQEGGKVGEHESDPLTSPSGASPTAVGSPSGADIGKTIITGKMRQTLSPKELLQVELHNHSIDIDIDFQQEDEDEVGTADLLALSLGKGALGGDIAVASGDGSSGSNAVAGPGGNDANIKAKEALDEKSDQESTRSIYDESALARVANDRATRSHQRNLVNSLDDVALRAQKKARSGVQCPYASIDIVFNHKHLYANLAHADPELIFYDFERHPERWCEFQEQQYRQYLGITHLKEFYPDRGLASVKAPQRDAEELEMGLTELLQDTIRTHRKYPSGNSRPSMDTEFLKRFEFQIDENAQVQENPNNTALAHILKRLDHEQQIALQPQELIPLIRQRGGFVETINYDYVDKDWRKKVTQDIPSGYIYKEECLFFKHSDSNRIASETIRRCFDMIEIGEFRKPKFAVGCRLYRMAASVCPVRVFVCCVAKDA